MIKMIWDFRNSILPLDTFYKKDDLRLSKLGFITRHVLPERLFEYFWNLIFSLGTFYEETILNDFKKPILSIGTFTWKIVLRRLGLFWICFSMCTIYMVF